MAQAGSAIGVPSIMQFPLDPADLQRRKLFKFTASALAVQAVAACGGDAHANTADGNASDAVLKAVADFGALAPEDTHCLIRADVPDAPWTASYSPDRQLFIGSAIKTFILGQFLIAAETSYDGVSESMQQTISDLVRSPGSPVFVELNGSLPAKYVLEAMIAHSDNTATDMAYAAVGADRVRQLIARAGLTNTRIPDSTRRLFSYLAGAPDGVDLGWKGLMEVLAQPSIPNARPAVNDKQSMLSTATELVEWYRQSLAGKFFTQPATMKEFKRILAMADAISVVVPADISAYGKGGSIDWEGFHAISFPGQMVVDRVPVTFCFTYNWRGEETSTGAPAQAFARAAGAALQACVDAIRQ